MVRVKGGVPGDAARHRMHLAFLHPRSHHYPLGSCRYFYLVSFMFYAVVGFLVPMGVPGKLASCEKDFTVGVIPVTCNPA